MVIKVKDGSIGIDHSILTPVRGALLIDPLAFGSTSKERTSSVYRQKCSYCNCLSSPTDYKCPYCGAPKKG